MILMDIQIPVWSEVYDFEVNEEAKVDEVLGEILCLIVQKEKRSLKDAEAMQLFALRQESLLDKGISLREQGVEAGDRLILI